MYREHRKVLERYVRRFLGNSEDAADVAQEAFLRVYAAEVGPNTTVSEGLLYTAARNLALSELRKRTSRATDLVGDFDDLDVEGSEANPETIVSQRQMIAAVEAAMQEMPPRCLEVFRLRKLDGLSHSEIGERLGLSTKTIERHITHALKLCHDALDSRRASSRRAAAQREGSREGSQ